MRLRVALLPLCLLLEGCGSAGAPLGVVDSLDLERYAGRWFEIASFPQAFQRGCVATTASYTPLQDGTLRVVNECRDATLDGPLRRAEGRAWRADPENDAAKLKVQFFWPFRGDYWVIDLDPEYRWAVVGHPSRRYLWILSRSPTLAPDVYAKILARIEAHGYELTPLRRTLQPTSDRD
jgi:apolipoprotein D and lipocalin family protein